MMKGPAPGSKEWLAAKSSGPLHEYQDARGVTHFGYMERYLDHGGTDQTAYMRSYQTGELSLVSGSRLKKMRIIPKPNPARRRTRKKARRSERGFFPRARARVKAKRRRNPAIRLDWHTFAGGTAAAEGKNSYQAITGGLNGREQYLIDPISWPNGRHRYYKLQYFGAGGYRTLATNARVATLKKAAAEHLLGVVLTATNPRRRNPARTMRPYRQSHPSAKTVAERLKSVRRTRRVEKQFPGRSKEDHGAYAVQVRRDKKWITLANFPFHASASDYGRALKTRYPSKTFRVFW